jgi:uncharacterized protein (TIGR02246 family)
MPSQTSHFDPKNLMTQTINDARELAERWSSTFTQADVNALMDLFAPDAVFLGTSSKTIVAGNEGIRNYFENSLLGSKRYVSVLTDIHVTALSDDVAIIAALNKITVTENNHTDDLMGRLSIAARKREGLWKIEHFHRSALPN